MAVITFSEWKARLAGSPAWSPISSLPAEDQRRVYRLWVERTGGESISNIDTSTAALLDEDMRREISDEGNRTLDERGGGIGSALGGVWDAIVKYGRDREWGKDPMDLRTNLPRSKAGDDDGEEEGEGRKIPDPPRTTDEIPDYLDQLAEEFQAPSWMVQLGGPVDEADIRLLMVMQGFNPENPAHVERFSSLLMDPETADRLGIRPVYEAMLNRRYIETQEEPASIAGHAGARGRPGRSYRNRRMEYDQRAVNNAATLDPASLPVMDDVLRAAAQHEVPWEVLWAAVSTDDTPGDDSFRDSGRVWSSQAVKQKAETLGSEMNRYGDIVLALIADRFGRSVASYVQTWGRLPEQAKLSVVTYLDTVLGTATSSGGEGGLGYSNSDARAKVEHLAGAQAMRVPDRRSLEASGRAWLESILVRSPSDADVDQFVDNVIGNVMSGQAANNPFATGSPSQYADEPPFDYSVELEEAIVAEQERVKETPEYMALYGAKPAYLSDAEWQQIFFTQGDQTIGAGLTDESLIRSAMSSGDPSMVAEALGIGQQGLQHGQEGSFRQRLYRASLILNRELG